MKNKFYLSDFDYILDEKSIAQHPLPIRDNSKMMIMNKNDGSIVDGFFKDFPENLKKNDLIVINDSKVLPARLYGHRKNKDESIEVFLLKQIQKDVWECIGRPGKKMRIGTEIFFGDILKGKFLEILKNGNRIIEFKYEGIWEEILNELGEMPLPPYIYEKLKEKNRYQTVYANKTGSSAAPTAGLHFTEEIFEKIKAKGANIAPLTLHVGLGTFQPVREENLDLHKMHSEEYYISKSSVEKIKETKANGGRIIAIGTTSMRVLETLGNELINSEAKDYFGESDIFISPGYDFQIVDALLTNFHLPKSTLLMLVSAFASLDMILNAYEHAQKNGYRFFSFGDCIFLEAK